MEKISGIIPASARVTSVDLSASKPVRPGAPDFGAPKGAQSQLPKSATDFFAGPDRTTWKTRDLEKANIVGKMSDSFFNMKNYGPNGSQSSSQDIENQVSVVEQNIASDSLNDTLQNYKARNEENLLSSYSQLQNESPVSSFSAEDLYGQNVSPTAYSTGVKNTEPKEAVLNEVRGEVSSQAVSSNSIEAEENEYSGLDLYA